MAAWASTQMLIGVVLAAGRGTRLGGPKALLAWPAATRTMPLAEAHARAWSFCDRVVVVTRRDIADALRELAPEIPAEIVVSEAADELGPAGSLSAAAAVLPDSARVLVTPVDCPPVQASTCRSLVAVLATPGVLAARPRHGTRRGHPVALSAAVWLRYRDDAVPLRDVLRSVGDAVLDVEVSDPGVLRDIDRPEDLDARPVFLSVD